MSRHTANVTELAVLEDQELFAARNLVQSTNGLVVEVRDDVGMGLENADVISNILGKAQQLVRGGDVGRNTQVGALEVDETQKVRGQRGQVGVL